MYLVGVYNRQHQPGYLRVSSCDEELGFGVHVILGARQGGQGGPG